MEEKRRGVVTSVNDSGVKIGEVWFNYSKFRQVPQPNEGDVAELTVKDNKWIQSLTIIRVAHNPVDKQTKITRSGLLNTAVAMLRTQNRAITVEDVIETAKGFEPYINEPVFPDGDGEDIPY